MLQSQHVDLTKDKHAEQVIVSATQRSRFSQIASSRMTRLRPTPQGLSEQGPIIILDPDNFPTVSHIRSFSPELTPSKRRRSSYNQLEPFPNSSSAPRPSKKTSTGGAAECDQDIIDLTIQEAFPVRNANTPSPKRRYHAISEDPLDDSAPHPRNLPSVFTDGDYMTDEQFEKSFTALAFEPASRRTIISYPPTRKRELKVVQKDNKTYKAGKTAQLKDGTFLRIRSIWEEPEGSTTLVGDRLVRQNSLELLMPKRRNELVWLNELTQDEVGGHTTSKTVDINLDQADRLRKVIFTNQRYPNVSLRDCAERFSTAKQEVDFGPLYCRWKHVKVRVSRLASLEESIAHLTFNEADDSEVQNAHHKYGMRPRIETDTLRCQWRGVETIPGGSHIKTLRNARGNTEVVDLENAAVSESAFPLRIPKYTYGDAFCGAGGASRGALQAGLHVSWGFDMNAEAVKSYTENFEREGTKCLQMTVTEFLGQRDIERFMVDVLHMSPPCQPFSPAHTVPSQERDETNQAALFSIWHLTESIKPRVATVEETEGLFSRHHEWFSALIMIFISLGYSVRWKIIGCQHYGVPQARKRLYIFAAGPGESLPQFPKPTHGDSESGLKPFNTIGDMVFKRTIPYHPVHHDTSWRFPNGPRVPFQANTFAKTITCSGGIGNYHPSGLRDYTIRENACLQTFPVIHSFSDNCKTHAKRQIGNAVPPILAKMMFKAVNRSLEKTDSKSMRRI